MSKPKPECSMSMKAYWAPPALRMWPMPGEASSIRKVPNLARRVAAISFNVVNATRGLPLHPLRRTGRHAIPPVCVEC